MSRGRHKRVFRVEDGERRPALEADLDESTPIDYELDGISVHDVQTGDPIRELQLGNSSGAYARRNRE